MACTIAAEYNTAAEAQITAAALSSPDTVNAHFSLLATNPFIPEPTRNLNARFVDAALAYFIVGVDNCPILVIPATSPSYKPASPPAPPPTMPPTTPPTTPPATTEPPATSLTGPPPDAVTVPAGAPCPQGFMPQQASTTSTATIEEMVGHQLLQIPVTRVTTTGPCIPLPTVTCVGEWVTLTDCLAVTILKTQPVTGLVLQTRVLGCDGQLYYSSYNLDNVPLLVSSTLTFPPTPGYLLDACVSLPAGVNSAGVVFATISLQHTCQAGLPPQAALASGYVTSLYPLSYPSSPGGAPYTAPTQLPGAGTVQLIQSKSGLVSSGHTVSVTFSLTVSAGSCLVALYSNQPGGKTPGITDTQTNTWASIDESAYLGIWAAPNAKAGATTITLDLAVGFNAPIQLHVMEVGGIDLSSPTDVIAATADHGPLTATTASTTYSDVAVARAYAFNQTGGSEAAPAHWAIVHDTTDAAGARFLTYWNGNPSTPNAPWAFTSSMTAADLYVAVVALRIIGQ